MSCQHVYNVVCYLMPYTSLIICDQIWEKPASMNTTARHTFHHQTVTVHVDQQFSQILMLKVARAAFAMACCWVLSDVHNCTGRLQKTVYPLGKQTAVCNSSHDWLMSLAMDLTTLCDMRRWKWHQWMPFGWFWWRRSLGPPLHGYPPTPQPPTLHECYCYYLRQQKTI